MENYLDDVGNSNEALTLCDEKSNINPRVV
jgi:hypothetical protein